MPIYRCINFSTESPKRYQKLFVLIIFFFLFACISSAQKYSINLKYLTYRDVLSSGTVRDIIQDQKGFMWFATDRGLNRYDGMNITSYKHDFTDPGSIADISIEKMFVDSKGNLWLGSSSAINLYDYNKDLFIRFRRHNKDSSESVGSEDEFTHENVFSIFEDKNGRIWSGTYGNIYYVDLEKKRCFSSGLKELFYEKYGVTPGIEVYFSSFLLDKDNILWIGTEGFGLFCYDFDAKSIKQYENIFFENREDYKTDIIESIYEDSLERLWIASDEGIGYIDKKTGLYTNKLTIGESDFRCRSIIEYDENNVWFGTEDGIYVYTNSSGEFQHYYMQADKRFGLANDFINTLYISNEGVLWVGHDIGGAGYARLYNIKNFYNYKRREDAEDNISSDIVTCFFENNEGHLWIGTEEGLDLQISIDQYEHYLHGRNIGYVYEDSYGDLWAFAVEEGLFRKKKGAERFTLYKYMGALEGDVEEIEEIEEEENFEDIEEVFDGLSAPRSYFCFEDSKRRLWFGGRGLELFDRETNTFKLRKDSRIMDTSDYFYSVDEDRKGNLWIGTTFALIQFDPDKDKVIEEYYADPLDPVTINSNFVWKVHIDREDTLWIGTDSGLCKGVNRNGQISFVSYGLENGLPGDFVFNIIEDDGGNLWLNTNNGLSKFNPKTDKLVNVDIFDGFASQMPGSVDDTEVISLSAGMKTRNGEIVFGGVNGITRFDPGKIVSNENIPPVLLRDFQIFNKSVSIGHIEGIGTILTKPISATDEIRLSYRQDVFSLDIIALSYPKPFENQYAYMMEGFDKDWIYTDARNRIATYTNLKGGDYVFRAKASNNDGVWNEAGTSIKIHITPPYWNTIWFRISLVIIILVLFISIYKLRTYSIRQRNKALAEVNMQLNQQITEREKSEAAREVLEVQLRQAQKMETVGQLAGGVAHDFNNILQSILGYTEMASRGLDEDDRRLADLKEVYSSAERAKILTKQLLAFSRRQVIQPKDVDLNNIISDSLKMFRSMVPENIILDFVPGYKLNRIHADSVQINQVLMNLIVNSRDAMPKGGRINIKTQNVVIDGNYCKVHTWAKIGDYVLLTLTDTGSGIDKETLEHLFEPFFTTKEVGKGTGLGLAMVYGIIKQHDGMIDVYSEIEKGTEFKIYLPISDETHNEEVVEVVEESSTEGTETILIAEDDDTVKELGKRILEEAGYKVFTAINGTQAVELCKKYKDSIDLALLDIVMPECGGHEASEKIKEINPNIEILFSSGYSSNGIHTQFVLEQGLNLIQKPYDPDSLLKSIRGLLDQEDS